MLHETFLSSATFWNSVNSAQNSFNGSFAVWFLEQVSEASEKNQDLCGYELMSAQWK